MPDKLLSPITGLSDSGLKLASAFPSDVLQGKTFYAGDKVLKTGTMTKMGATTQAVNSTVDSNKNLVVRITPGLYTNIASSGYPEVYLPIGSYPYQTNGIVLVNMRSSTIEAAMVSSVHDENYVSISEKGNYATYTILTPGNYQLYATTSVSWLGDAHMDVNGSRVLTNDGTSGGKQYNQTLHFDYGNTITAYCQRSTYTESRQANMFVYLRLV